MRRPAIHFAVKRGRTHFFRGLSHTLTPVTDSEKVLIPFHSTSLQRKRAPPGAPFEHRQVIIKCEGVENVPARIGPFIDLGSEIALPFRVQYCVSGNAFPVFRRTLLQTGKMAERGRKCVAETGLKKAAVHPTHLQFRTSALPRGLRRRRRGHSGRSRLLRPTRCALARGARPFPLRLG